MTGLSAWVYVVAAAAVLFVLWAAAVRGWWRSVRYSWQRAAHVLAADEAEARGQDFYGSMTLAGERALHHEYPLPWPRLEGDWLPMRSAADFLPAPDWREQTAADLAPEALNDQPDPYLDALTAQYGSEYDPADFPSSPHGLPVSELGKRNSGPGAGSSLAPGPDPAWLDGQLAVLYAWVRDQYATALA